MYSRNSFGDFYPVKSSIHSINSIVKFLCFLIFIIIIVFTNSLELHLVLSGLLLVMTFISNVPIRFYFNTIYSLRFIFILLVLFFAYLGFDLILCIVFLLKIIILLEYLNLITYTTSSSELYYAIEKTLIPFNIFKLNVGKIALYFTNMVRFIPMLITTEYKILKTQSSRGIDYQHSDLFGRLYAIVKAYKNTFRISFYNMKMLKKSCEHRMFNVRTKRSNLSTNKVGFNDFMILFIHTAILLGFLFEEGLLTYEILT